MIKKVLNDNCIIYKGDCFDAMQSLLDEGKEFDCILTDPPYGNIKGLKIRNVEQIEWDTTLDNKFMYDYAHKLLRVRGRLILFSSGRFTRHLYKDIPTCIQHNQTAVWLKPYFTNPLQVKQTLVSRIEDINIFTKCHDTNNKHPLRLYAQKILNKIGLTAGEVNKHFGHRKLEHFFRCWTTQFEPSSKSAYEQLTEEFNLKDWEEYKTFEEIKKIHEEFKESTPVIFNLNGAGHKSNVFEYQKSYKNYHPSEKPVDLLKDLIQTYTNPNDWILDFTMGSGSTGVAALETGRKFIGIEKEEEYFNIAVERLKGALQNENK